jgi:hypothetical protein
VEALEALDTVRERLCERANPLVLALIEDQRYFVHDAKIADGRGHFLAGYDGEECEQDGWCLYRVG